MEPEKEQWINKVLGSLDGIQRAEASPFLFAKIRNRLTAEPAPIYVPLRTVWLIAASFAMLLLLNWGVAASVFSSGTTDSVDLDTVITDMHLYPSTNQLY